MFGTKFTVRFTVELLQLPELFGEGHFSDQCIDLFFDVRALHAGRWRL
jgi:hypothetical protein